MITSNFIQFYLLADLILLIVMILIHVFYQKSVRDYDRKWNSMRADLGSAAGHSSGRYIACDENIIFYTGGE